MSMNNKRKAFWKSETETRERGFQKTLKKHNNKRLKVLVKVINKNTNQCQSIKRVRKIQEKFKETQINVQLIQFLFNFIYIVKVQF